MSPLEMMYQFEQSADKVSSKNVMNLSLPAKIVYLNRGQINFALSHYDGRTPDGKGFEQTQKRTQDLQRITRSGVPLKVTRKQPDLFVASTLEAPGFMILVRTQLWGKKGDCAEVRLWAFKVQTGDLEDTLASEFKDPDWQWREVPYRQVEDNIEIFTDEFSITRAAIDYLRYPLKIDIAGYTNFDGSKSTDQACELPDYTHYAIVAMAAMEFEFDVNNPQAQSKAAKLQLLN